MTVAVMNDFLLAYGNVQKPQQKKVREFIELFQENPTAPGIQYHPIERTRDPNLYSVRIDQTYRAIIYHPRNTDIYVLVWVDNHDEAYDWAENKVFRVNPLTGSLQVVPSDVGPSAEEDAPVAPQPSVEMRRRSPLDKFDNRSLMCLGVPEALLPMVRTIQDDGDLHRFQQALPQEAFEALFHLLTGCDLHEVLGSMAELPSVDPPAREDIGRALSNDDSRRRFHVIEGARDLAELLDAPLEQWRVFLHPRQRRLVTMDADGPVCVLGGAGTGKTVVAMHRAKHLIESVFTAPTDRILLTTFTKNLVIELSQNLKKIVGPEDLARIEVVNLDNWVAAFLRKRGYKYRAPLDDEESQCWEAALQAAPAESILPMTFYRQEWEKVIQAQDIQSLDQYLQAPRPGRGSRISREVRTQAWGVFAAYRAELEARGIREYLDMVRDARRILEAEEVELPYRAVVVDETQDMSAEALRLIRALVPKGRNDIFVVGDAHQRIYRHKVSLRACGIDIRGRREYLKVNYRTTDEICGYAGALLDGREIDDLAGGLDEQRNYVSLTHGEPPEIRLFRSQAEEQAFIREHIRRLVTEGSNIETICLTARTRRILRSHIDALRAAGLEVYEIKADAPEELDRPALRVATMHRIKGLEFEHVIVASANKGVIPLERALDTGGDEMALKEAETAERALLYVALTRARKSAVVSGYGVLSQFLTADGVHTK